MFQGIHHVAIICSNYAISKHFYTSILGFDVLSEHFREDRASYKLDLRLPDGSQIELFSFPDPPERINNPEAQGLRHLAFKVSVVEDVVSYLKGKNVHVEPIRMDELTGKKYTFFKDPDGLPLELYQAHV